jgi:RNA polymerase sigma factor (sigma-70 family)
MGLSDEAVLTNWVVRREGRAFQIIVSRYTRMVYGTCRRIMGNENDAEEVAQECFETLAEAPDRDRPRELGPWLHGVAVYKSLTRLRAEGRRRRREGEYASEQAAHVHPTWNDVYDAVDEAIGELPEELRVPIVYHYLCGYSHGRTARAMGIPRRTVSHRIGKGLELIAESLRKRGVQGIGASIAAIFAAGFAEAVTVPASLTATLGRLVLEQVQTAPAVAGTSIVASIIKWVAVVAAAAVIVEGGFAVKRYVSIRGTENKLALPDSSAGATAHESTAAQSGMPSASDAQSQPKAVAPAGETGTVSGRVVDGTITAEIAMKINETMMRPQRGPEQQKDNDAAIKSAMKPLADVEIVLGEYEEQGFGRQLRSVRTDDAGRYQLADVPIGRYTMRVIPPEGVCPADDAAPDKVRRVEVKAGETKTEDFSLRQGVRVKGRVTDRAARPLEGAEITATPIVTVFMDQSYARVEKKSRITTLTESDGTYSVDRLIPAWIKNTAQMVMTGGSSGGVIEIAARAEGYAASRVFMHPMTPEMIAESKTFLKQYERLRAQQPQHQQEDPEPPPASLPLAAFDGGAFTGIDLRLEPESVVSGTLVTSLGRPVAKTKLKIAFKEDNPPCNSAEDGQTEHDVSGELVYFVGKPFEQYRVPPDLVETDEQGRFEFRGLSAGEYTFELRPDEWHGQQARNEPLNVGPGQRLADVKVVVEDPDERVDLQGLVVDAVTRQPLSDVKVWQKSVELPGEKSPQGGLLQMDQNRPGAFMFKDISPGTVVMSIEREGYGTEVFKVDAKREAGREVTFALAKEAVIEGRVTVNGEPKEVQVMARRIGSDDAPYAGTDKNTGEYRIKGVTQGEYVVFASPWVDGPTSVQRGMSQRVALKPGQTARVDLDIAGSAVLQGKVTWPSALPRKGLDAFVRVMTGPAETIPEGLSVESIESFVGGAWDFRSSDEYRITSLPAGEYTVVGRLTEKTGEKKTLATQARKITLQDGQTVEMDFDFSAYAGE